MYKYGTADIRVASVKGDRINDKLLDKILKLSDKLSDNMRQYYPAKQKQQTFDFNGALRKQYLKQHPSQIFYYSQHKEPKAYALVQQSDPYKDTLQINDLYVQPQLRGSGIGTAILSKIEQRARRNKVKKLLISYFNDNPAKHLYDRVGFSPYSTKAVKDL